MTEPSSETILTPKTILIYVDGDKIGDGTTKLPFLRALRAAYPSARITYYAGRNTTAFAGELAPLTGGLLDEVIDAGREPQHRLRPLNRPLQGRHFDLVLDTQRVVLTTLTLRRIPHRCFVSGVAGWRFSDLRGRVGKPPHLLDRLLQLVAVARFGRSDAALATGGRPALPADLRAAAAAALPVGAPTVLLAPGAGLRTKCWPLARFIELARSLAARGRRPAFLLGPAESDWRAEIAAALPDAELPLERMPETTPLASMAVAERAHVCVVNEAGPGHLCAAVDRPLVMLFGPTPPGKFFPRVSRGTVIRAQDFGGGAAMEAIPVEAVRQAVERLLADAGSES